MGRTDNGQRVIEADPARVWAALTDPQALAEWLPPAGMTGTFAHFDLRVGGGYRMVLRYDDPNTTAAKSGDGSDVVDVRFVEIVPGERIVQAVDFVADDPAFAGTMRLTWSIEPVAGGTRVEIRAEDVPSGISAEDHAAGLASSLANLAEWLG